MNIKEMSLLVVAAFPVISLHAGAASSQSTLAQQRRVEKECRASATSQNDWWRADGKNRWRNICSMRVVVGSKDPDPVRKPQAQASKKGVFDPSTARRVEHKQADRQPMTFMGDPCTSDCSGHEAGYAWAEENDITDPDDCDGNSNSFIEGCESFAEENGVMQRRLEDYGDDDPDW